jgi:hypothetical protein
MPAHSRAPSHIAPCQNWSVTGRSAIRPTLEVAGIAIALAGLAAGGSRYLANYGEHYYSCAGKPTPCLTYSRVEDTGALTGLGGFAAILLLLLSLALWRVRRPSLWSGIVFVTVGLPLILLLLISAYLALGSVLLGPPDSLPLIGIVVGLVGATATAAMTTVRNLLARARVRN